MAKKKDNMLMKILASGVIIWLLIYFYSKYKDRSANIGGLGGGNTGNSGNTGNTGNSGNTGNTGNSGNTGNNGNTGNPPPEDPPIGGDPSPYEIGMAIDPESTVNTLDLSSMYGSYDDSKFIADWGFEAPVFRGETTKAAPLQSGFSHMHNSNSYPAPILPDEAVGNFITAPCREGGAIDQVVNSLIENNSYPNIDWSLWQNRNWNAMRADSNLMQTLAQHYSAYLLMVGNPADGDYRWGGLGFYDEEENGTHDMLVWNIEFCNYIQAHKPDSIVLYYGYPSMVGMQWNPKKYHSGFTAAEIANYKASHPYGHAGFKNGNAYFDGQDGYVKTPMPITTSFYQKDGSGNYIISNGKRVFKTGDFEEYLFGKKNVWRAKATPQIVQYAQATLDGNGQPIHEIIFAINTAYRFIANWRVVMCSLAYTTNNNDDSLVWRDYPNKPISVQSLLTEPWTMGQNTHYRRWLGQDEITFLMCAPLLMGYEGIELWETGHSTDSWKNPDYPLSTGNRNLPNQGDQAFVYWMAESDPAGIPDFSLGDDNLTRYKWAARAISRMREVYSHYTKDATLKYLDFCNLGQAFEQEEIIAVGMYQGSNCHILFYYPYQDPTDSTNIQLDLNGTVKNFTLHGRKALLMHFTGSFTGANQTAFKMQYNTLNGVTKKVTGDFRNHTYN